MDDQIQLILSKIDELKAYVTGLAASPEPVPAPVATPEPVPAQVKSPIMAMIESPDWPEAVLPSLICDPNNEADKIERAGGIVETYLSQEIKEAGVRFLDFGCGEGHVVREASKHAYVAVGYDLIAKEDTYPLITADFDKVKESGPYDVILLYDVLDHATDPVDVLRKVKEVASPKAKIFVRCHPWCSIHGGHLYKKLNKAYAHLFLTNEEIQLFGELPKQRVVFPMFTYKGWIQDSGLVMIGEPIVDRVNLDAIFSKPLLTERIFQQKFTELGYKEFPKFQLEQTFLDYKLSV